MLLSTAVFCLAVNVYHEARGEPLEGQYAVAQVTLTRAQQRETGVCHEVLRPKQFSWTTGLVKFDSNTGKPRLRARGIPREPEAWARAFAVSAFTLLGVGEAKAAPRATHYHATYVMPYWAKHYEQVAVIGNHIFYR